MAVATLTAADRADPRRLVDGQVLTHLPDDWEKALAITMQTMRAERLPVLPRMWEVPDVWPLTGLSCRPLPLLPQESRP